MRTHIVTTPYGLKYSVVDWLNGLHPGPLCGFGSRIYVTLLDLSRMTTECEISDDTYNFILDTFCDVYFSPFGYSQNVSDLIVVTMKLSTSTTAHDEAYRMIRGVCDDLQVQGHGPNDSPWAYTEMEKQTTLTRLQSRPNAGWWWQRKTELVCREGFQSRIRSHGLPGSAEQWNRTAIEDLMARVAVEECHLRTYLRTVPLAQAVALLSRQTIPGESASSGESPPAPRVSPRPVWDSESSTLRFNGEVIRTVRPIAKWRAILDTFHDDNWPPRIDNPVVQGDLGEHLRTLNDGLEMIRFDRDGSTEGIFWKLR